MCWEMPQNGQKNPSQNKLGNHCFIMCYKQYIEGYDE